MNELQISGACRVATDKLHEALALMQEADKLRSQLSDLEALIRRLVYQAEIQVIQANPRSYVNATGGKP